MYAKEIRVAPYTGRSIAVPSARGIGGIEKVRLVVGEEVRSADELAERVPGVAIGLVVGRVVAFHAEVQRHTAVLADDEDVRQLLEVGAVVLVVTEGDCQCGLSAEAFLGGGVDVGDIRHRDSKTRALRSIF